MGGLLGSWNVFFGWLGRASLQAAVVIVLVLLVQWAFSRQLTPRWRHALWFLVVIRLALPGALECKLSLFNLANTRSASPQTPQSDSDTFSESSTDDEDPQPPSAISWSQHSTSTTSLRSIWLFGAILMAFYLLTGAWYLNRKVRKQRPVTNEAVLNLLEDCKQEMGVLTPLTLLETPTVESPSLLGFIRPRLLLPAGLMKTFSPAELRFVFLHELGHLKRGDILLHWLMAVTLVVHWFNPLVWYAIARVRADGEAACDDVALSHAREGENQLYGNTIIKLLERFSCPAMAPGLVGILENKNQMKRRIGMIAKFKKTQKWPVAAASLFASLALLTLTDAQSQPAPAKQADVNNQEPPQIVSTTPNVSDTEVDPSLSEITVTFDRDMSGGMSWAGGPPELPNSPAGTHANWRDKRTCVLPVKLQAAHYYCMGINSPRFRNFRSEAGQAAKPSILCFTTRGASDALKAKVKQPIVMTLIPANGATDVDPNLKEIRVTFNVPMGRGCSWCGSGEDYPGESVGNKLYWTDGQKTCVLPVTLKPDHQYNISLNNGSESASNFRNVSGLPLLPVAYTFKTKQ